MPLFASTGPVAGWGRCTRGMGLVGWLGGLYRVPSQHHPGTHIEHILALRPYLRPNEGKSEYIDEVSQD